MQLGNTCDLKHYAWIARHALTFEGGLHTAAHLWAVCRQDLACHSSDMTGPAFVSLPA